MYEIFAITDIGCVRENNEDSFLIQTVYGNSGEYHVQPLTEPWIAAVADGMGGEQGGGIASKLALEELQKMELPITEGKLSSINEKILEYGQQHHEHKGLGTTLSGFVCRNRELTLFHIGDSRAYRYRDGFLKQLSQDHSLVESLYQSGQINRLEKHHHAQKHVILSCLGMEPSRLKMDLENVRGTFEIGDLFLLCSDGLSDKVTEEQIETILQQDVTLDEKARSLVAKAKEMGGEDNITLILMRRMYEEIDME